MCHAPPLGGSGIDAMGSVGVSLAGGVSSPGTATSAGRRDGDRQGDHSRGRDAGEAQRQLGHPLDLCHRHRLSRHAHLVCHRPLRDRQAPAAPPRRERRRDPRQYRLAGRDPHRRRVRGALHGLQPHVADADHHPGRTAAGQRESRRQGRRTGASEHAAVRDEHAQERLPGHHEPRAPHAAEQHPGLQRSPGRHRRRWTTSRSATCRTSRSRARPCWK